MAGRLSIFTRSPCELISPLGGIGSFQKGSSALDATQRLPLICCAHVKCEINRTSDNATKWTLTEAMSDTRDGNEDVLAAQREFFPAVLVDACLQPVRQQFVT